MEHGRVQFGSRLRQERETRALSLGELARITKIPQRTLERLEAGLFDELPAEVFVRGFVKSYARAVGLDADDTVRRYGEILHGAPVQPAAQATPPAQPMVLAATPVAAAKPAASAAPVADAATHTDEAVVAESSSSAAADPAAAMRSFSRAILDAGRETRRMPLTLAVIILVIVATLTMSLLLDPPGTTTGGAVTQATPVVDVSPRA